MLTGGSGTPSREGFVEQTDVRNQIYLHPSPVGKFSTAGTGNLIAQKFDGTFVNSIVVRFDYPVFVSVEQANQALVLDGSPKQFIDIRVGSLQRRAPQPAYPVGWRERSADVREFRPNRDRKGVGAAVGWAVWVADVFFELGLAVLSSARVDCAGNSGIRKLYRLSNPFRAGRER
jgi:hypothetical protein